MRLLAVFLLIQFYSYSQAQDWTRDDISIYKTFDEFEHILHQDNDTTYLINFWATWCSPCVAELPYIDAMHDKYKNEKFKSILVSLDFEKQIDSRLIPFLNKNKIQSDIIVLLDGKSSRWIDKVDNEWSGAIPITIVYNNNKRAFYEKQFHSEEEMIELIDPFINN
jgi:thiol-disulfide isomerase/thioredoxin